MTVTVITETSAAEQQKRVYNEASGMIWRGSFTPSAGVFGAVVGVVLADAVVDTDIDSTLIPAIEALSEVISVIGDQPFGQIPASILAADHECKVHIVTQLSYLEGYGADTNSVSIKKSETLQPPVGKKWTVFNLRIPAALDQAGIAALEAALEGITGITTAEHAISITVPSNATNVSLTIEGRMRIDAIPV